MTIEREGDSMSERRAAQRRRIAERSAIVAQRNPMAAWVRRGAPDDDVKLAYDVFIAPAWGVPADGLAPHDAALLRWMLFGVAPIAALGCLWLLGANLRDARLIDLLAVAVDGTLLLVAMLVAITLGRARRRAIPTATRRFVTVAGLAGAVIGIVTIAVGVLATHALDQVAWPTFRAVAPLACHAAALVHHRRGDRRHRAIEKLAHRCALEVHVGATALRAWLHRCWEGEVSSEKLERRPNSAYLVAGRIEGFEVAIEVRPDDAVRPAQILVAAVLDAPTIARLVESLRASGFIAEANAAGVVASPERIDGRAIVEGRDEALGVLCDGANGIAAFLLRAGVHPRPPLVD